MNTTGVIISVARILEVPTNLIGFKTQVTDSENESLNCFEGSLQLLIMFVEHIDIMVAQPL